MSIISISPRTDHVRFTAAQNNLWDGLCRFIGWPKSPDHPCCHSAPDCVENTEILLLANVEIGGGGGDGSGVM